MAHPLLFGQAPSNSNSGDSKQIMDQLYKWDWSKRRRDAEDRVNQDFYNGDQWYRIQYDGGNNYPQVIVNRPLQQGGMIVNVATNVINTGASIMLGQPMYAEPTPASDSEFDDRSSKVARVVLRDHEERNHSHTTKMVLGTSILVSGDVWVQVFFDPTVRGIMELTPEEAQMYEQLHGAPGRVVSQMPNGKVRVEFPVGATREEIVPAVLMFFPPMTYGRWDDVTEFCRVGYMDRNAAMRKWPDVDPAFFQPMGITNKRGTGEAVTGSWNSNMREWNSQTGDFFDQYMGLIRFIEKWEQDSSRIWHRKIITGDRAQYEISQDTAAANQYIHYHGNPTGNFWSVPQMSGCRKPQFSINSLANYELEYFQKSPKDVWIVPRGTQGSPMTNEMALTVEWDAYGSGSEPKFIRQDSGTLGIVANLFERYKSHIYETGNIASVTMGIAEQRLPSKGIDRLIQANSEPLLRIRSMFAESEKEKARRILQIAQAHYGAERLALLGGNLNEGDVQFFSSSDLVAGTDVRIVESTEGPQDRQGRRDLIAQLADRGWLVPEAQPMIEKILYFEKNGEWESLEGEDVVLADRNAQAQEDAIAKGFVGIRPRFEADPELANNPIFHVELYDRRNPRIKFIQPWANYSVEVQHHMLTLNRPDYPEAAKDILHLLTMQKQYEIDAAEQSAKAAMLSERKDMAIADQAGVLQTQVTNTALAASLEANKSTASEPKSSPAAGGRESGRTRSRE